MDYVAGFLKTPNGIVLVKKNKPEWQAGKLNGIGGKVEDGEDYLQAMIREWKEETQTEFNEWEHFCTLEDNDVRVFFFKGISATIPSLPKTNDIGEELYFTQELVLPHIPNLKWLIPMAFSDPSNPTAYTLIGNNENK